MRSNRLASLTLGVALAGVLAAPGADTAPATTVVREASVDSLVLDDPGYQRVLVHVGSHSTLQDGLEAADAAGLRTGTHYDAIKVFVAYGDRGALLRAAQSQHVEAIEANTPVEVFTETSHKATRGQDVLDGAITGPRNSRFDGSGVGVAVIDSGVDGTHPDLADRMGGNVKLVCSTPQFVVTGATGGATECLGPKTAVAAQDTDSISGGGHGTHVAGTVAGTGAASGGRYHGAAPGTTLYGVSIGTVVAVENGLDGLAWVLANHDKVSPAIKVVNNSWGTGHRPYDPENGPLHKATWKLQEALVAAGVTVVFAAGNSSGDGTTNTTSAECVNPTPGVICVANFADGDTGARNGEIDKSSSRGMKDDPATAKNEAQPQNWPDISAPGTSIVATCRVTLPVCNAHFGPVLDPPNLYAKLTGTSMAAPHVAGIAAQLYQAKAKQLTPAKVENLLEDTAYKFQFGEPYSFVDTTNPDNSSSHEKGHGLVDALGALQTLLGS